MCPSRRLRESTRAQQKSIQTNLCKKQTSLDVPPTSELRAANPDRLWYFDHQDAPDNTEETWWALSNENGNSPAFWTAIAPFNLTDAVPSDTVNGEAPDSLERRLPSYIDFYKNNRCSGRSISRCSNILPGTCCSDGSAYNGQSIEIPSVQPGDILAIHSTRDCVGKVASTVMYGFAGCWPAKKNTHINSVLLKYCTRC